MKAFISYCLTEQEQYIATLLSYRLREQGFALILSNNSDVVDVTTKYQIFSSELFVGLITLGSPQWRRVMQEYDLAINNHTLAILLVEEGVNIDPSFPGNYVVFNRHNLQQAIEEVRIKMTPNQNLHRQQNLAWLLGGAAIVAFLALLDNNNRK
jgi:hypothetical protein